MSGNGPDFLPNFYDDNMICFLPQGPGVVFGYWELSRSQWEAVAELGGAVLIRLYKVVDDGGLDYGYATVREVELPPNTKNWYFEGLDPDTTYVFEVCCRLPEGSLLSLVKSENVTTPPVPRFDTMPGKKSAAVMPGEKTPDFRPVAGWEGSVKGGISLDQVLESMPFYMGYNTQLTG